MKTIYAIIAAALIAAPAAADDWSREDTYRQAAYTVLHFTRWSQARDNRPSELYLPEDAAVYGPAPLSAYETRRVGRGDINRDYALSLAAHFVVARLLPEDYREAFQLVTIGVQGYGVLDEYRTTVGFNLSF